MVRQHRTLTRRIRVLITIAALYACRRREKGRALVRHELRRQVLSRTFFSELFIHLSLFLGYPTMLDGLECVSEASPGRRRISLKTQAASSHKKGKQILERIYGRQAVKLLRHLETLYPGLGHRITQDAYGLIMSRSGLTLQERELTNVVVLFAHRYKRQLYSHLRGSLRVGVSKRRLKAAVALAARVMGRSGRKTLKTIEEISAGVN